MPRATSSTFAPSSSLTFAISLMNEILVARKAFEASLIISADATSVRTTAASSGSDRAGPPPPDAGGVAPAVRGVLPHHHPVRVHEVGDSRALLQELRVRHVAERVGAAAD